MEEIHKMGRSEVLHEAEKKLHDMEDELKVLKMLKNYEDNIRDKMNEKDKILSDHKKRIDDLENENIKLLKKDLDKSKEEIKNKPQPKHTYPRIKIKEQRR